MLALIFVIDSNNLVSLLDDLLDICLLQNLDSIGGILRQVLELPQSGSHNWQRTEVLTFSIKA